MVSFPKAILFFVFPQSHLRLKVPQNTWKVNKASDAVIASLWTDLCAHHKIEVYTQIN